MMLSVIALLFAVSSSFAQEQSVPLSNDEAETGLLTARNIVDVYTFTATVGDVITIRATSDAGNVALLLLSPEGLPIQEVTSGTGTTVIENLAASQTGSYTLTVFGGAGNTGADLPYQVVYSNAGFSTEVQPTAEPTQVIDIADETETPNDEATEEPIIELTSEPVIETTPEPADDTITTFDPPRDVLISNGIEVRLEWDAQVDLNLEVRDPIGNTLFFGNRTSPNGGSLSLDANGLCEIISDAPAETVTWSPGFLPTGSYEILVYYEQYCPDGNAVPVDFTLSVTINGEELPAVNGTIQSPPIFDGTVDSVYLSNFIVSADAAGQVSGVLNTGGYYPDTAFRQLPAPSLEIIANPQPISVGQAVRGVIVDAQDYLTYSFEAEANDVVSVSMTSVSGSLDTLVQLVGPNGNLLDVNDDFNNSTNSTINGYRILQTGTHTVVATRYGKEFGGTEGEFSLVVSQSTAQLPANLQGLGLPDGEVEVYLTWATNADIQLLVRDPVGQPVYDDEPRIASGGTLAANGNANCVITEGVAPVSYIYWPLGFLRPGIYEVDVWYQSTCEDTRPVTATLSVVVNNQVIATQSISPTIGDHYLVTFQVNADGTSTIGNGGFESQAVATLTLDDETPIPVQQGQTVNGSITIDNPYDVYTFQGTAGQTVTIELNATSQTLDTVLYLLDANNVVLVSNDDADQATTVTGGRNTNSRINSFTLQSTGEYQIIATRYGVQYGGTVGTYNLVLR